MAKDIIKVSAVQFDIAWEDKESNLHKLDKLLDSNDTETDLIVLPEMFTTGFSMNPEPFSEKMTGSSVQWMIEQSKKKEAVICGSLMIEEFGLFRNRFLWVKPSGGISFYDKRHPFCLIDEGKFFTKGQKRGLFEYLGWTFMPSICYDLRFPVWLRNNLNYDVLINVANWPSVRSFAWKQFGSSRALENQAYAILLNRVGLDKSKMNFTGDSRIISFDGKSLVEAKENEEEIISTFLSKQKLADYRDKYPFGIDRDEFTIQV
jgi:omega-amidase